MARSLFQYINPVNVGASGFIANFEDYTTGNPATDVVSMENYDSVLFLVSKGGGAVGTATITVEACSTALAAATQAIVFDYWVCTTIDTWSDRTRATTAGFTTTAGADQMYAIEVHSSMLTATYPFVRLQFTEVDSTACDGHVIAIMGNARYPKEVPITAIS